MATDTYYFTGDCKWAKLTTPDKEYEKWSICLFMDDKSKELYGTSGLGLKDREDDDGHYTQFSRKTTQMNRAGEPEPLDPPTVITGEGESLPDGILVGNGSNVTVKVEVYDTKMGKGHRFLGVRVNTLVPYEGGKVFGADDEDSPF